MWGAYPSNDRSGVVNGWLGEGELGHRGHVRWLRVEPLPLTAPDSGGGEGRGHGPLGPLGPVPGPRLSGPTGSAGSAAAGPRSDDGGLPHRREGSFAWGVNLGAVSKRC